MALKSSFKSILHYLILQPDDSGNSLNQFLLYFTNNDFGKLDLAISETILRDVFHKRAGSFYFYNKINSIEEFKFIVNRGLAIEICDANQNVPGKRAIYINYLLFS